MMSDLMPPNMEPNGGKKGGSSCIYTPLYSYEQDEARCCCNVNIREEREKQKKKKEERRKRKGSPLAGDTTPATLETTNMEHAVGPKPSNLEPPPVKPAVIGKSREVPAQG